MFALVDKKDNSITKFFNGNKGVDIGDNRYSQQIFTIWSEAERNAIDIYTIEMDNSKRKDEEWYINTSITYSFDGSKAKGSYGDAAAIPHADKLYTKEDEDNGLGTEGEVKEKGKKSILIDKVKKEAANELNKTDWYVIRKTEEETAIPSAVTTHRKAVRSKQAEMETAISNASDIPALETLYTRNNEGVRPLGDIPQKDF